ncbi:MAG TPA: hypothetical protein DDZ68_02335 [Parvularcula sp.]|nr:hypothetical protein [Parvularcula sp.]
MSFRQRRPQRRSLVFRQPARQTATAAASKKGSSPRSGGFDKSGWARVLTAGSVGRACISSNSLNFRSDEAAALRPLLSGEDGTEGRSHAFLKKESRPGALP